MEKINITIDNKKYKFNKGITLLDIAKEVHTSSFAPLVAYIDNEIFPLDKKVTSDCVVKFITVLDSYGNKIYQKGLIFVLVYAFKELFGYNYHIKTCHSIDKAIKIRTNLTLTHDRLNKLKAKMKEIIDKKMLLEKCLVRRKEAEKYFLSTLQKSKANTFIYNTDHYVTLYKLGDMYDYFFSPLPISTEVFKDYDLFYLDKGSFILQFPVVSDDGKIPPYVNREKIIEAFDRRNYSMNGQNSSILCRMAYIARFE